MQCYSRKLENALVKRLDSFPLLSPRDNTKLRELSNLLLELLAPKNEGYLLDLAYLDTPGGIKLILEKLSAGQQNKWQSDFPFFIHVDFVYG